MFWMDFNIMDDINLRRFVSLAVLLVILFQLYLRKQQNLPPGPFSWPLVGSVFSTGRTTHRTLARLAHKYGPIMYIKLGSRPHVVISSPELAKQVLKHHDVEFASRPQFHTFLKYISYNFNNLVMAPYGERWKMLRRISGMELFTPARVMYFAGIRKEEFDSFDSTLESLASKDQPFDLTVLLHELFTNLMTRVLFGRKFYGPDVALTPEAREYRAVWSNMGVESQRRYIGDYIPILRVIDKLMRKDYNLKNIMMPATHKFINKMVEQHKADYDPEYPRDFVDVMLSLNGENKLDNQAVIALLRDLLQAGTMTSKGTVEWGITELIRNPRVQRKAHEELDRVVGRHRSLDESDLTNLPYLQCIVKETLRLHPIATTGLPHYNHEDVNVVGYTIPANTTVVINIWAIHHDPNTWSDPDNFIPERFVNTDRNVLGQHFDLLPFSSGRRRCVGIPLAMPHITLALGHLLHRFEWRAPQGEEMDMEETTGFTAHPAKHRIVCASRFTN